MLLGLNGSAASASAMDTWDSPTANNRHAVSVFILGCIVGLLTGH